MPADGVEYRYFKAGPFIQGGDNRFDPSLCNMMESRREDEDDVVVEDGELATRYSSDVSPYGVWGRGATSYFATNQTPEYHHNSNVICTLHVPA